MACSSSHLRKQRVLKSCLVNVFLLDFQKNLIRCEEAL